MYIVSNNNSIPFNYFLWQFPSSNLWRLLVLAWCVANIMINFDYMPEFWSYVKALLLMDSHFLRY